MTLINLSIVSYCDLPLKNGDTVALCMLAAWAARTTGTYEGYAIAYGRIITSSPLATPTTTTTTRCCCDPCNPCSCVPVTTTCSSSVPSGRCLYLIEIDTTQFDIDSATGTNYVPVATDFYVDVYAEMAVIFPFTCILDKVLDAINALDARVAALEGP